MSTSSYLKIIKMVGTFKITFLVCLLMLGCAGKFPEWKGPPDRENAFPSMDFEDSSPRRKASLELTKEGVRQARRGSYVLAMKKFEKAIDIDPSNPYAYYHYGVTRHSVNQYEQSLELLELARDKFGDNNRWQSKILAYKALNYKAIGDVERAREFFRRALDLDHNNELARRGLAETYGRGANP